MNLIKPLFTFSFWFSYYAVPFSGWVSTTILFIVAALLLAGIIALVWKRAFKDIELKHAASRVGALGITMSIVALFLWFVTFEGIPFLSMRVFWLIWVLCLVSWGYLIVRGYKIDRSNVTLSHDPEREAYEKYLPRPKKK